MNYVRGPLREELVRVGNDVLISRFPIGLFFFSLGVCSDIGFFWCAYCWYWCKKGIARCLHVLRRDAQHLFDAVHQSALAVDSLQGMA